MSDPRQYDGWVAPSAQLIGDVRLASDSSVWFGAILRGEAAMVEIGPEANVQDNCLIEGTPGHPARIGARVSVGHNATVSGATVEAHSLIAIGATVLPGAYVGAQSIVAANATVPAGMTVPPRTLLVGHGRLLREVTAAEIERIERGATEYVRLGREYGSAPGATSLIVSASLDTPRRSTDSAMTTAQPATGGAHIDALLQEDRRYSPTDEFKAQANWNDPAIYARAEADPEAFWAEQAAAIDWFKPWDRVLDWNPPLAKWFVGAEVNASYNCVDRHLKTWRRNKAALIFEGEPGDSRVLTYRDLYREVNRAAAALKRLGVKKGDRVVIYLGMVPELPIAMLACARIGATHTVIFAGFSAESIADRANDSGATFAITADGGWRRGNKIPLKETMDKALQSCPAIKTMLVVNRTDDPRQVSMQAGRDIWWHRAMDESGSEIVEPEHLDAEHPLYILYTSGTTGKPKGMLHTTGGYLVGTSTTHKYVFDLKEEDVFFCTADIGWVTGHSYIVYGPLANGATCVMYEGSPDFPDKDRFWSIVEKLGVTILYTAPTAIRTFMRWGKEYPAKHDLTSLRVLGSVGEPINPEAWVWYREVIGLDRCPVVDTWWMTETGQILITPLPGMTVLKPGSATMPFPSIKADVLDEQGNSVPLGKGGYLVLQRPWPAMARTIWGDAERYATQYWSKFPGNYFAGDGARRDEEGYYWLLGRVDDVLNVAGHRIGTMEVESALVSHPAVAESAVIGVTHEIKGQGIAAFVTLRSGFTGGQAMVDELRNHVGEKIGAIAKPDQIFFTAELPKTRSAKIMRRLLRDIAEGKVMGDTTTLADPAVLAAIKGQYEGTE